MKVFRMNECDWVAANSMKEAIREYLKNCTGKEILFTKKDEEEYLDKDYLKEVDIEKEKMWYSFSYNELFTFLRDNPKKSFEIKFDITRHEDFILHMPFKEVLELENMTDPYLICSTEY